MGSYIIQKAHLLYKGTLYLAEEWDRDYEGCVWRYAIVKKDLPDFGLPLNIRIKGTDEQKTLEILEKANTLEEAVRELTGKGIICFPDCNLLYELDIEKDYFSTIYPQNKKRHEVVKIMSRLFGAVEDYPIRLKENWFVKVICPEYVTIFNEEEKIYKVFFVGKEIKNIYLDLNGLHIEGDEFLKDIIPTLCKRDSMRSIMYIVTY
jgi:hypothetical protein